MAPAVKARGEQLGYQVHRAPCLGRSRSSSLCWTPRWVAPEPLGCFVFCSTGLFVFLIIRLG